MESSGKVKACSSIESYLSHTEGGWRYCLSDIFSFDNGHTWGWKEDFHQILEMVNMSIWSSSEQIRNVEECCHFWNSPKKRTGIGKDCCERNTKWTPNLFRFLELGWLDNSLNVQNPEHPWSTTVLWMIKSDKKKMGESRNMIAGLYDLEETIGEGHYAVVKLARCHLLVELSYPLTTTTTTRSGMCSLVRKWLWRLLTSWSWTKPQGCRCYRWNEMLGNIIRIIVGCGNLIELLMTCNCWLVGLLGCSLFLHAIFRSIYDLVDLLGLYGITD